MKRYIAILLCLITCLSMAIPAVATFSPTEGAEQIGEMRVGPWEINGDAINLRSDADINSSSGGLVYNGDTLDILGYKNDSSGNQWVRCYMTSGQCYGLTGYVLSQYVRYGSAN